MTFSGKLPNLALVEIWTFIDLKVNFAPQKCSLMCGLWPLVAPDGSGQCLWTGPDVQILLLLLLLSRFSRVRLCAPHRRQPTRLPIPGILQARTMEWVAISFSNAKWKVKVKLLSRVWFLGILWTAAYQAPPSMVFSRQECWSRICTSYKSLTESARWTQIMAGSHYAFAPSILRKVQ